MSAPGLQDRMSKFEQLQQQLPTQLPDYLLKQRWFGSKARGIRSAKVVDMVALPSGRSDACGLFLQVTYEDGGAESYVLPMMCSRVVHSVAAEGGTVLTLQLEPDQQHWLLSDALRNDEFLQALLLAIEETGIMRGVRSEVRAFHTRKLLELRFSVRGSLPARLLKGEQSNSSVVYDDRLVLKIFRKLVEGVNPDLEIGKFLTEKAHFQNIPPLAGWLEYQADGKESATLAILQGFVPNSGDAWSFTLQNLSGFWEEISQVIHSTATANAVTRKETSAEFPESAQQYFDSVKLLAKRTAQLHAALASDPSDPNFAPQPFTESFGRELEKSIEELTRKNLALLGNNLEKLPRESRHAAEEVLRRESELLNIFRAALRDPMQGARTRIHGDYHLGQVLFTGSDFMIIDFEGEPARSLSERRSKRSALQDVAGMLRSFHYAAHASLLNFASDRPEAAKDIASLRDWAERWYARVSLIFVEHYLKESERASYLPADRSEVSRLLAIFLLDKAIYELGYELNNRPTWIGIPLSGIAALLAQQDRGAADSHNESGLR